MYLFLTILILLASLLLIFIVLVQNSKGGGLASGFSSSNQVMGVRKTTDFLEKATWALIAIIIVLSVATVAFVSDNKDAEKKSIIKEEVQNAVPVDPNLVSPNFNEEAAPAAQQQAPANEAPAAQQQAPAQQAPAKK
jgi:preprotein translocase subunit SecG